MNHDNQSLEQQIEAIKRELVSLGPLQPGSLSMQYNVCGTPGCRCKANPPQKHGPYHQISYTRKGKGSSRYVTRDALPLVKQQLLNYERLRTLVDRWVDLSTMLCAQQIESIKHSRKRSASDSGVAE
jgi:hypothetical protein